MLLVDRKDRFGLRRLALDWRLSELDRHTIRVGAMEFARALAELDVGRARLTSAIDPEILASKCTGQFHHLCTTRMSDDAREGVVDRNCRVHSKANLFVGGSSVFASGGVSNPTYTIVQLALRLGDHLLSQLR